MSDKNKLHYYFTAKSASSHETCDTPQITTMDKDINNTNEVTVLCEIDGNSLTSSYSSIVTSFESQNQENPGRSPEAAREFLLLGPYQPITTFPTVNHRHFCLNCFKVYNWAEFSEMNKNA